MNMLKSLHVTMKHKEGSELYTVLQYSTKWGPIGAYF